MTPTARTKAALLALVAAILGYEGWALLNGVDGDSISAAVWSWSDEHPDFAPLFLAANVLLLLHFFARWRRSKNPA